MRLRYLTLLSALAILSSSTALAQAYDDDIYYNSNTSKSTTKVSKQRNSTVANAGNYSRTTKTTQPTVYSSTIENDRDVDEYNRRGGRYAVDVDTLSDELMDTSYNEENYANTKRLERFYNPDIVSGSDDAELIDSYYDSYYDDTPTVNLYIGSNWGWGGHGYSIGWGVYPSYYSWYDPWYDPWYGPSWYYSGWYGPRWNHWGWGGWYDPWYAGWGWNYGWGWAGGWYAGWHHGGWYGGHGWHDGGPGWRDGGRGRDNWGYNSIGNGGRRSMTNTSGARRPMSNGNSMSGARGRSGYASLGTNNSNAVNGTRRATSSGTITGHRGASTTNRSSVGNVGSMSSRRSTLINRSTMSSGAASTQSARATASQSNSTISRSDINNSTRQSYSRSSAAQSSSRNSYNTTTSRSSSSYSTGRSSSGTSFGGSGGFSGGGRSSGSVSGGHRR